jgi:pimeloyl-ACP methyl ester carboxylesterase
VFARAARACIGEITGRLADADRPVDPQTGGMKRFTSFDGLELSYQDSWIRGDLPPVVLHHGFATDGTGNWVRTGIAEALVTSGRYVVIPDARGHGESAKPHDPAYYGESKMARDLRDLFDLIGAAEVDLVGYSMGGIVALLTAAEDHRVRRLVVGGIGASVAELGGVDSRVVARHAVVEALLADDPSTIADPQAMAFRAFAEATGADRLALAAQAQAAHHAPIGLDRIGIATLVLAGADDQLARRPEALAAALPDAKWRVLPGDHLTVVRNPDFAAAIVAFLA